ncbi:mutS protein homolog 5-like isoform X2 [Liolophura sinensis]
MLHFAAALGDWQALYKTSSSAASIGDLCRAQKENVPIFTEIGKRFTEGLQRIATLIHKLVDFEESAVEGRFVVKSGVVPELDEKRRIYNGLPYFMTEVAKNELEKLNSRITTCNVIYVPQVGFLLTVPVTERMIEENNFDIPGLEFMYLVNDVVHYKSKSTLALDVLLGDTHHEIADHETKIMFNLQSTVLKHSNVLTDVMHFAAELDCLMCLASCAKEFNYVRPELTQDKTIHITAGRHPLQEMCSNPFVPNDTQSGGEYSRVKILTGPNASGKSVYIRQVALIVYMAHIGSFVPAESARICIVDRIFSRVQTKESVSLGMSTFMVDLNQMSDALRSCTENSLVIIDEFGRGTGSVDGMSLLCSALTYWLSKDTRCPHILVSTHFHSLIRKRLIPQSLLPRVTFQTMDTLISNGELIFLYQLKDGYTGSSFAMNVITEEGLTPSIVTRAVEVLMKERKPIERVDTARSILLRKRYNMIATKFAQLDVETAELYPFLKDVVLEACKGDI